MYSDDKRVWVRFWVFVSSKSGKHLDVILENVIDNKQKCLTLIVNGFMRVVIVGNELTFKSVELCDVMSLITSKHAKAY